MAEMKMQGVEYDERMEELEKLEYPKPNREFIYSTFNAFADRHPWVGQENIQPKSIAREMFEQFRSFSDYISDYELQRAEGLLLRHLNSVYKVLAQTVPDAAKNDTVREMELYLGAMIRQVDSSLLDEWEKMRDPNYQRARNQGGPPARRAEAASRHYARHEGVHRRDPHPHLQFPARPGDWGLRGGAGPSRFAGRRRRPAVDGGAAPAGAGGVSRRSTSAFAWTPTRATCAHTYVIAGGGQARPGACSRCWWTRRSTTIGWRSLRWTWGSRGRPTRR